MILKKSRLLASFAFFAPYTVLFYLILGVTSNIFPSEKLVNYSIGFIDFFLLFLLFIAVVFLTSISLKRSDANNISLVENLKLIKINIFDILILIILIVLHLNLNFLREESIRHLDDGISSVGMTAYLYYFIKPASGLILLKFVYEQKFFSLMLVFIYCLSMFFMPSSALDIYFIFALFLILWAKNSRRVNVKLISLLSIIFIFGVIYTGFSIKSNINDLALSAIISELQYRAGIYPTALSFYFNNFYLVKATHLVEIYGLVNEYRIMELIQLGGDKPDIDSLNRLNFTLTNLWDSSNLPGSSPGIWASFYISPFLFLICLPIYSLTIKYAHKILLHSGVKNWWILFMFLTPLFFSILVSPFDFIFMIGGGWFFILYLIIPGFSSFFNKHPKRKKIYNA